MNSTYIDACFKRPTNHTPIWIMRQAGRYMPQYQEVRGQVDFLTLCKTPDLATKVTLLPIDLLNVDAAILFSDILIPLEPMGISVAFEDKVGPILSPVRDEATIKALRTIESEEDVGFVMDAIRMIKKELDGRVPLIGFSGSPFTLATYAVEGGTTKSFHNIKGLIYSRPELADYLMDLLADVVINYLNAQVDAGAQAIQIFDTWGGILADPEYVRFSLKPVQKVIANLKRHDTPVIYYLNNGSYLAHHMDSIDADVIGIDWRQDIGEARRTFGRKKAVQGNLDPTVLFASPEEVRIRAHRIMDEVGPEPGHIFNLGHGILPQTPMDNAIALVQAVHEYRR
ncbi:MAG: uroporphyrinogen decarboxylase [bacterium]|nr:uroporphyrinogen decarboxylase [bacterium]MDT8365743.1 uroporphyrinogen decarboxylase [bacterium]